MTTSTTSNSWPKSRLHQAGWPLSLSDTSAARLSETQVIYGVKSLALNFMLGYVKQGLASTSIMGKDSRLSRFCLRSSSPVGLLQFVNGWREGLFMPIVYLVMVSFLFFFLFFQTFLSTLHGSHPRHCRQRRPAPACHSDTPADSTPRYPQHNDVWMVMTTSEEGNNNAAFLHLHVWCRVEDHPHSLLRIETSGEKWRPGRVMQWKSPCGRNKRPDQEQNE